MPMQQLKESMERLLPRLERRMQALLPEPRGPQAELFSAMRYSVEAGGKRLRPLLCILSGQVLGSDHPALYDTGCAIEMIHTYSLIHDDLPALDNDNLRRGRPTNHVVHGEAMAILAGDALLNLAFETLARLDLCAEKRVELIDCIGKAAGSRGMIAGQVVDIQSEGKQIDRDLLAFMHAHKTGALICSCLEAGAIIAGAHSDSRSALRQYGEHIGLAFQIADDLLDIEGDQELMGKPQGSDERQHKATWPALIGIQASRTQLQDCVVHARELLQGFPPGGSKQALHDLAGYVAERKH